MFGSGEKFADLQERSRQSPVDRICSHEIRAAQMARSQKSEELLHPRGRNSRATKEISIYILHPYFQTKSQIPSGLTASTIKIIMVVVRLLLALIIGVCFFNIVCAAITSKVDLDPEMLEWAITVLQWLESVVGTLSKPILRTLVVANKELFQPIYDNAEEVAKAWAAEHMPDVEGAADRMIEFIKDVVGPALG